jgi:hypothetical protein
MLHRAHIVNKPRVEDRRVVVLLCPLCHNALDQRDQYADDDRPRLTVGNAIWLKQKHDPRFYDLPFLLRHSVRQDLEAEPLPEWYAARQMELTK